MAMATTSVEANKAAIRRLYDETNKGNYDFLDELLAPDFTSYGGAGFKDLRGHDAGATTSRRIRPDPPPRLAPRSRRGCRPA